MIQRKIYLEGELGERFGSEYTIHATTFQQALRCLDCNLEGFREYFISASDKGLNFIADIAGSPVTDERELLMQFREGDFVLSPAPAGSKSGGAKILAAIALAVITYGASTAITAGAEAAAVAVPAAAKAAINVGYALSVNLALTGIQEIMAPDPSVDNEQEESYLFQGAGQVSVEGDPVPILYGKLRVPGRPISVEISNRLTFRNVSSNQVDTNSDSQTDNGTSPGQDSNGETFQDSTDYQDYAPQDDFGL